MCDPIFIGGTTALLSGITSSLTIGEQNANARAQGEAANRAALTDYERIQARAGEISAASAQDKLKRNLQTARERAKLKVAQGEAGIAGNSSLRELNNSLFESSFDKSVIEANRKSELAQLQASARGVEATNKSRVNQANSMISAPLVSALTIGGSMVQSGLAGYSLGDKLFEGASDPAKFIPHRTDGLH